MLQLNKNKIEYNIDKCQQCGACASSCPKHAISFETIENGLKRVIVDEELCIRCKRCVHVCPSNRRMVLNRERTDLYLKELISKKYFLAWSGDNSVRCSSSSGGATKTFIIESLKSGFVDGVYSLRKLEEYPSAVGEFYTKENLPDYETLPNSVYHSVMACTETKKVKKVHRLMLVGTSCQLYALERTLKGKYDELVKVCIFCKQQKTFDSTRFLAKIMGIKISKKHNISTRYRGEGWPGIVHVGEAQLPWNRAAVLPFGRRLWTVPGCNVCGDPFGMEVGADVSVMDPWDIKQANDLGETLVTVHTDCGLKLILQTKNLEIEEKSYKEIIPALGIGDIWRKRVCVPYFLGKDVDSIVKKATEAEMKQRRCLEWWLEHSPKLPIICYRLINKIIPKKRDKILRDISKI